MRHSVARSKVGTVKIICIGRYALDTLKEFCKIIGFGHVYIMYLLSSISRFNIKRVYKKSLNAYKNKGCYIDEDVFYNIIL